MKSKAIQKGCISCHKPRSEWGPNCTSGKPNHIDDINKMVEPTQKVERLEITVSPSSGEEFYLQGDVKMAKAINYLLDSLLPKEK